MTYEELPFSGIATFFKAPLAAGADDGRRRRGRRRHPLGPGHHQPLGRAHGAARPARGLDHVGLPARRRALLRRRGRRGTARRRALGRLRRRGSRPHVVAGALPQRRDRQAAADHELRPLPRHARRRSLHRLPGAQGALPGAGRQARPPRAVRHAHGLLGGGGRPAILAREPHHPQPRGRLARRASRSTASAACTRPATTSPWLGAAERTSSGASRPRTCASTTSSSTCPWAATSTSPSTSTRSTRRSRRAPARPSPAASTTTRPRTSSSPSARAATWSGMDLVEVAPQYDGPGQLTALHGARLILDTVGAVFRRRASLR